MWGWKPDGFRAAATRRPFPRGAGPMTQAAGRLKKADNFFSDSFLKGSFSLFLQPLLGQIGMIPNKYSSLAQLVRASDC